MSSPGQSDDPMIGEGDQPNPEDVVEQLRSAAEEAMEIAREGAREKEEELWARYRELRASRREQRKQ